MKITLVAIVAFALGIGVGALSLHGARSSPFGFTLTLNTMDILMINHALMKYPDEDPNGHARETLHKIRAQVKDEIKE